MVPNGNGKTTRSETRALETKKNYDRVSRRFTFRPEFRLTTQHPSTYTQESFATPHRLPSRMIGNSNGVPVYTAQGPCQPPAWLTSLQDP